jgi:hypothetical protein
MIDGPREESKWDRREEPQVEKIWVLRPEMTVGLHSKNHFGVGQDVLVTRFEVKEAVAQMSSATTMPRVGVA